MSHLGDRVAALVDGEMSHDTRDRLLAHVARCAACRAEVEAARTLKLRLSGLGGPGPSPAFTARLRAMSEPGEPLPPERPRMPGGPGPTGSARLPAPRSPLRGILGPRSRGRRYSFVAASVTAVTLTTAVLVGSEEQPPGQPVTPPVDEFAVEHAGTTNDLPLTEPAVSAVTSSVMGSRSGRLGPSVGSDRVVPPFRVPTVPTVAPLVVPTSR